MVNKRTLVAVFGGSTKLVDQLLHVSTKTPDSSWLKVVRPDSPGVEVLVDRASVEHSYARILRVDSICQRRVSIKTPVNTGRNERWLVSLLTVDRKTVEMAKKTTTKRTPRKHQKRLVKDDGVRTLLARMLTCKETGSVLKAILDGINLERIATAFRKANETPVHKEYRLSTDARSASCDAWVLMGRQGITQDFIRRIEFRIFIDKEDVNWAFRLAMLHVADLRKILDDKEYADLQDLLRRAEGLRLKFGDKLEPRHVLMFMYRQLKTMRAAEALYSLLVDKEKAGLGKTNPVALILAICNPARNDGGDWC